MWVLPQFCLSLDHLVCHVGWLVLHNGDLLSMSHFPSNASRVLAYEAFRLIKIDIPQTKQRLKQCHLTFPSVSGRVSHAGPAM